MRYRVVLIPSEEGFAVGCPTLPGCWSQGQSEEEALEDIREAIADYLAGAKELFPKEGERREVEVAA